VGRDGTGRTSRKSDLARERASSRLWDGLGAATGAELMALCPIAIARDTKRDMLACLTALPLRLAKRREALPNTHGAAS
jgi:hypothetical protein